MKDSWLLASTELNHRTSPGALFLTLLQMPLRYLAKPVADMRLVQINRDQLKLNFDQWTEGSAESPLMKNSIRKGNLAADSLLEIYS